MAALDDDDDDDDGEEEEEMIINLPETYIFFYCVCFQ